MAEPLTSSPGLSLDDTEIAFASRSNSELMKMDWLFSLMNEPKLNNLATSTLLTCIRWHLPIKPIVKYTIFTHFCGGETLEECTRTIDNLARFGIGTILDYSVEGEKTDAAFDHVVKETQGTIRISASRKDVPFAVFKTSGICDVDIMEKAQFGNIKTEEEKAALLRGRKRFGDICAEAGRLGVRLFIDSEETWVQNTIDQWTYEEMEKWNTETAIVFNTYQMYRSDMLQNLKSATEMARSKNFVIGAKLVRGAYMEKEAEYAEKHGLKNPIQPSKAATDTDYDAAWKHCLDNLDLIHFCSGSHNENSNLNMANTMNSMGIAKKDSRVWFAQLFGMGDSISYGLAQAGFNVVKYVPYGPVLSVMPYLVRRATENTSVAGQTSRELMLIKKERARRKANPSPNQI